MEDSFLLWDIISIIILLFISSYSYVLSKKLNIPYVILLFIVWIILVIFHNYLPFWSHVSQLKLSWDMIFYVFLPVLIFESSYGMPYKKIIHDRLPILGLSIWGYLISSFLIWVVLMFFLRIIWYEIPFLITLLFWAIISATDPVAVISIFKKIWAPKRLTYLFESESLMNDWTSVALFLIILEIIRKWVFMWTDIMYWIITFISMMVLWIIWWWFIWVVFSKMIQKIESLNVELTLALILAHFSFISWELISQFFIHLSSTTGIELIKTIQISPIISTTIAWLTLWNYWRYKLSKKTREQTSTFFEYFSFLSNSLIFLLMWILIWNYYSQIIEYKYAIIVTIAVVLLVRVISVYSIIVPINKILPIHDKIPNKWIWFLSYWSLRWAIAITMILILPSDLFVSWWENSWILTSPSNFLLIFTVSCIAFTLIVKALTIWSLAKRFSIANYSEEEIFTMHQVKDLIDKKMISLLKSLKSKKFSRPEVIWSLITEYSKEEKCECECIDKIKFTKVNFEMLLKRYALWIEKDSIVTSFENKEVDEFSLKIILNKIEKQFHRIERWLPQIKWESKMVWFENLSISFYNWLYYRNNRNEKIKHSFLFYRARSITAEHVISELKMLQKNFYKPDCKSFDKVIALYKKWYNDSNEKKNKIFEKNKQFLKVVEQDLVNKHVSHKETRILKKLYKKHILTWKVYEAIKKEFTCY